MDLDGLVKLYSAVVQDDELDSERRALHHAICETLGVDEDAFSPFEGNTALHLLTDEQAERMIRAEIARCKGGKRD